MTIRWPKVLLWALVLLVLLALFAYLALLRPVAQPPSNDPLAIFNHGSIGNEEAQGLPYWIWRVLPQIFPDKMPGKEFGGNQDGYGAFGLYWKAGAELPVGFSKKTLGVIPRVSINCAFCHQGSYRLHPDDVGKHVAGGAGTRVNPQGYIRFLAEVGDDPRFTPSNVMAAITAIYDMPWWERLLYRFLLIPATKKALGDEKVRYAWTYRLPGGGERPVWGVGRIDPFNPVKFYKDALALPDDGTIGNSDMMPLWGLNHERRAGTRSYALHWDGLNRSLREVVVSGAIGDGMTWKSYQQVRDRLEAMEDFIRLNTPPSSPFSPDAEGGFHVASASVEAGRALYREHCAECHDPTGARFRDVIPWVEVRTDRHRIDMWTDLAKETYSNYEPDYHWGFKAFQNENGYVANELTGLWLKGPYLHNGSVPTLRDLLRPPAERPKTFWRGYDLVDAENGGFVAADDPAKGIFVSRYSWLVDTSVPGNGNGGHAWGTDLEDIKKEDLLSYLKTL